MNFIEDHCPPSSFKPHSTLLRRQSHRNLWLTVNGGHRLILLLQFKLNVSTKTRHSRRTSIGTTESAAVVFSNTFATSKVSHRRIFQYALRTTRASIGDLPTELLEIIFKFVYMKSRVPTDEECYRHLPGYSPDGPYETMWDTHQNLLSPSLFPYALASVCTTWRDVLSTIPVFWTRVVILIDTNPTVLPAIQSYFKWTHNLPLDVAVMRRSGAFDPDENARVLAVIDLLGPHVHRCRSLQFDVIYSSSLPSLRRDFHGVAPELDKLVLKCRVDDGGSIPSDTAEHGMFACPVLQTLVLDGRNFLECMIDARPFTSATSIEILHLSPSQNESFPLYQMLRTLEKFRKLRSLKVREVEFDFVSGSVDPASFGLSLSSATFEDLQGSVLTEIFRVTTLHPEWTTITRCSVDPFDSTIWTFNLTLEDIAADQDLREILRGWYGRHLYIYNCPGFDDIVIAEMGQGGHSSDDFIVRNITELCISDCPNFSVGVLKEMVDERSRIAAAHEHDDTWDEFNPSTVSRIAILDVNGYGPLISPEDVEWFEANVDFFGWCTTLPDGRICRGGAVHMSSG